MDLKLDFGSGIGDIAKLVIILVLVLSIISVVVFFVFFFFLYYNGLLDFIPLAIHFLAVR